MNAYRIPFRGFAVLAGWLVLTIMLAPGASAALGVGKLAPMMELPDLKGETHSFAEFTSKPMVLVFVKPEDRYSSVTLGAIEGMYARRAELTKNVPHLVVISRLRGKMIPAELISFLEEHNWRIFVDEADKAYRAYEIIATPTVLLIDQNGRVVLGSAGYDVGLVRDLRENLGRIQGLANPHMNSRGEKPNMALQMGRRMAERGLWDKAKLYYDKVREDGALAPKAQVEYVVILIEAGLWKEAGTELDAMAVDAESAAEVARLRALLESGRSDTSTPAPPRVNR